MKILVALLLLTAPLARATSTVCALLDGQPDEMSRPRWVAAAKAEKTGKSAAPAPTTPAAPPPKPTQRQERAPKPALPAYLFM